MLSHYLALAMGLLCIICGAKGLQSASLQNIHIETVEGKLVRRSPLPDPREGNSELTSNGHLSRENFLGRRRRREPPPEDELEIDDLNDSDSENEEAVIDPMEYMPDHSSMLKKALNSADKHHDEHDWFGEKPMKWLTRATASVTMDPELLQEQLDYYANKANTHPDPQRRQRATIKGNLWRGLAVLARDEYMQGLIETTGQRYAVEKERLRQQRDELYQGNDSNELLHQVEKEYETVSRSLQDWLHPTGYRSLINAQLELFNYQDAWQQQHDAGLGPLESDRMMEHAANAIAWKIKARQLAMPEDSRSNLSGVFGS